jgi:hypothetical protein
MSTTTDASGNYNLAGVPVGQAKVTVSPTQGSPSGEKAGGGRRVGRVKDKGNPGTGRPKAPTSEVPVEYQGPARALLTFEVKLGENKFPIELKSPLPK